MPRASTKRSALRASNGIAARASAASGGVAPTDNPPTPATTTVPTPTSFYDDPHVYDVLHARGTARDVTGLERIERLYSKAPRSLAWLEPACGTARYLRVAARRGRRVVGFDLSPVMIEYARGRMASGGVAANATLFAGDMIDFDRRLPAGSVGFAFNLINTIRHLHSDRDMLAHFAAMSRVLAKGGVYIVGISLSAYGIEPPTEDHWQGRRGGCTVSQVIQFVPPPVTRVPRSDSQRIERAFSHLTITRGSRQAHADSTYGLRTYNLAQWLELIERSALKIAHTCDERGRPYPPVEPGYCLFVLSER